MHSPSRPALLAIAACLAAPLCGCYSGEKLVEQVRKRAIRTRMDELPLGNFRVTLPTPIDGADMTEIDMRVYGEAPRYRIGKLEDELATKSHLLGDRATRILRQIELGELIDPNLESLRERMLQAVNEVLEGEPIEAIGFHEVRIIRH